MNHANDADRVLNELLYFFVRPLLVSSIFKCSYRQIVVAEED
jgi:hypothetical protein